MCCGVLRAAVICCRAFPCVGRHACINLLLLLVVVVMLVLLLLLLLLLLLVLPSGLTLPWYIGPLGSLYHHR